MSFVFESVHGLGGGMFLTAITVAWMGSEQDWQPRGEPAWQRGLTGWLGAARASRAVSRRLLGAGGMHREEAEHMHLAVFPKRPLLAASASCTCRHTALGSRSAEELPLVNWFPFSPASIIPLLCPYGAAAYFRKGRGNEPFAPSQPPCIPSPHCPDLHINVLSLVG